MPAAAPGDVALLLNKECGMWRMIGKLRPMYPFLLLESECCATVTSWGHIETSQLSQTVENVGQFDLWMREL